MSATIDRLATFVLVLAALAVATSVVYRSFIDPLGSSTESELLREVPSSDWEAMLAGGALVTGREEAPVTLAAFVDLQCPACASLHSTLKELHRQRPEAFRVLYIPYPLGYHAQAVAAAHASECAGEAGSMGRWVDLMYQQQDSLESKSWGAFALEAGIRDTSKIRVCAERADTSIFVAAGRELGQRLGVDGVPTLLIEGWELRGRLSQTRLDSLISSALEDGLKPPR